MLWLTQNAVRRLSRLDDEFRRGHPRALASSGQACGSPYQSRVEWLASSDIPVVIESSPRRAVRLPPPEVPAAPLDCVAESLDEPSAWCSLESQCRAVLSSLSGPCLPLTLQHYMDLADFDALSALTPSGSPNPLRRSSVNVPTSRRASLVTTGSRRSSLLAV